MVTLHMCKHIFIYFFKPDNIQFLCVWHVFICKKCNMIEL